MLYISTYFEEIELLLVDQGDAILYTEAHHLVEIHCPLVHLLQLYIVQPGQGSGLRYNIKLITFTLNSSLDELGI